VGIYSESTKKIREPLVRPGKFGVAAGVITQRC